MLAAVQALIPHPWLALSLVSRLQSGSQDSLTDSDEKSSRKEASLLGFDIPVKLSGDSVIALYHWDKDSNNQSNSPLLTFAFHSLFVDSNNLVRVSPGKRVYVWEYNHVCICIIVFRQPQTIVPNTQWR